MQKSKLLSFVLIFIICFISLQFVFGFQGSSSSYTTDNKQDTFTSTNSTSASGSFTNRFIGGIQAVSQYVINSVVGRFGILEESQFNLAINITSPLNNQEIIRGNDASSGEDDKGSIPDSINISARVYDETSNTGFNNAVCYFYDNNIFFGNSSTNSSGNCFMNYTKSSFSVGIRNLTVNYSISTSDTKSVTSSQINISIVRYVSSLTMGNLRSNGKYYDGDNATLSIAITKVNVSGTSDYDPQNISANATNAAQTVYPNGVKFYPGVNITRTGTGAYTTNVSVNYSFGSNVRWDVLVSDSNYTSLISTAVHSDEDICSADFGAFSEWSTCSGGTQTRTRTDSSGCSEVETQSCDIGDTCFLPGTKISTLNGYKNIEDVKIGDKILSYNESSEETAVSEVLNTFTHETDGYLIINEKLKLTGNHPIFLNGKWARTDFAKLNDYLTDINGSKILIKSIKNIDSDETVYNLEVKSTHTYYAEDIIVHNKGGCSSNGFPDWSTIPWGLCIDGVESRTRTDNCDNSETQFQDCGCEPNWNCGLWGVCSGGVQTRTCNDLNQCDLSNSSYTESQACTSNLVVSYTPQNSNIDIVNGTSINFNVNADGQGIGAIDIKWHYNGAFQSGDSGVDSVSSSFNRVFYSSSSVKADVITSSQTQSISWNINVLGNVTGSCTENWYCQWSTCMEDGFRYSDECSDLNACGTDLNRPFKQSCSCTPNFECSEWSECTAGYDFSNVLQGSIISNGTQTRTCSDKLGCENNTIESRSCVLKSLIEVKKTTWCFQDYIEIYDKTSGQLLSRIKDYTSFGNRKVDIGILGTDFEGYCNFCYDGVKNYDETDIDCGGSNCPVCVEKGEYFDWQPLVKNGLWSLIGSIIIIILWIRRKDLSVNKLKSVVKENRLFRKAERVKPVSREELVRIRLPSIKKLLSRITIPALSVKFSFGKIKRIRERGRIRKEIRKVEKEARRAEREAIKTERAVRKPRFIFFSDLRRKIKEWQERRYYDTSRLEKKLSEETEKKIKLAEHPKKRKKLEKIRRKEERKRLRHERKHFRKQAREIKRKIRKKEIHKIEIHSLRRQLTEWKAKGYDTSRLQKKIDKYEGRNPLK